MTRRSALPHPLPEPLVELIARRFRVIGEPMRIHILDHLRGGEASVQELTDSLLLNRDWVVVPLIGSTDGMEMLMPDGKILIRPAGGSQSIMARSAGPTNGR